MIKNINKLFKDNKFMEEKKINIIKNKINRYNDIKFIYNLDK